MSQELTNKILQGNLKRIYKDFKTRELNEIWKLINVLESKLKKEFKISTKN
jgi:hypothetical protein